MNSLVMDVDDSERFIHANPGVKKAYAKLQAASRELVDAFKAYTAKFSGVLCLNDESMQSITVSISGHFWESC